MTDSIAGQPWMSLSATRAVMAALQARGGPDAARFVGGCVRNAVMGLPAQDIDIATVLTPDAVMDALAAAGLKSVPTGVEHGTVTAIAERRPYEVTTLRRDVATDGRRAVVAFTTDWSEDAERRDFRLNALYADAQGRVFDPTGSGVDDAKAGRVVFVGDAAQRVREDHLRILRFFRFLAWYGRGEPDAVALAACEALKNALSAISAERISKELLLTLAAPDPRLAVRLMARTGVLDVVLPGAGDLGRFDRLIDLTVTGSIAADPELRLAALSNEADVADRLRLSNAQRLRLAGAAEPDPAIEAQMSPSQARAAIYRIGAPAFQDRVKLCWAASAPDHGDARWPALLALADRWTAPRLPVGGQDAIAAGAAVGPPVGAALSQVEAWWIDRDFPDDRGLVLDALRRVVQAMG